MKKIYDLIIRIPVFQADDGTLVGEAQTVLPRPAPGAPYAVETTPRAALVDAVDAIVEFATGNSVLILGEDTTPLSSSCRCARCSASTPRPTRSAPQPEPVSVDAPTESADATPTES